MSSKISALTESVIGDNDFVAISRSGSNFKLNLSEAIGDKLNIFYVEDAAMDGSTDDRAAIQAVIDACYTAGGGIVQLKEGTYRVQPTSATCLVLRTGVHLRGMGMSATIIESDNSTTTTPYNIISPYGWNTATSPYTAEEIMVSDLTIKGTQYSSSGNSGNLHNLVGFCSCPKGLLYNVGFENGGAHFAEFNRSKNCWIVNCATVGNGNHGTSKFQLDPNGQAGGMSDSRIVMTISNSASHASGLQTLLTVNSTTGVNPGDLLSIASANGTAAAAYNATGGWIVTEVPSSTTVAINMAWPTSVATPATTAGTATVECWVENCGIINYIDKAASDETTTMSRSFLDLSHNTHRGCYRNIYIKDSYIVGRTSYLTTGNTNATIGFDSSAYPNFFDGLFIENNTFTGGTTGQTIHVDCHVPNDATYQHRRISNFCVKNNKFLDVGFYRCLNIGNSFSDSASRSPSSTPANEFVLGVWKNICVENNKIYPIFKSGNVVHHVRAQRGISIGSAEMAVISGNTIHYRNLAPPNWKRLTASSIDTGADTITFASAHGWSTGQDVVVYATSGYPGGVGTSTYYVIVSSSTAIKLATSVANAQAGTAIDITSTGGGTIYVSSGWGYVATNQWGFKIDHVQQLTVENNKFRFELNNQSLDGYFYPFVFGCANFELPSYNTTISNSASADSGLRTTLTVSSSSSFKAGDKVFITGANGTNASQYNRTGGYFVTSIPNGTSITINLVWQGNATTAGTITATRRPIRSCQIWENNRVESGPDTGVNISRPFTELISSGTEISTWASTTSPATAGVWRGNLALNAGGGFPADTAGGAPHLNVGATALTTSITTASESENTLTKGRHRWGYGPRYGVTPALISGTTTIPDALITANSVITVSRITDGGTVGCSYSISRTAGTNFTITSKDSAGSTQTLDTSTLHYVIHEPN